MNRRETADAAPHPPIRPGLANYLGPVYLDARYRVDAFRFPGQLGRSDPPVKPWGKPWRPKL